MRSVDRLRLAVALAHAVPDARLHLDRWGGHRVVAGAHPSADLTVCQLRQVVLASLRPDGVDWTRFVRSVAIDGNLVDLGAGIYRRRTAAGGEQRWFVA